MYRKGVLFGQEVMTYLVDGRLFVWHGGPYVDMLLGADDAEVEIFGERYFYTAHNINVWDYDSGAPTIEWNDSVSFIAEVEAWLETV